MYFEKSIKLCFAMLKREKSAGLEYEYICPMHENPKSGIMILLVYNYGKRKKCRI